MSLALYWMVAFGWDTAYMRSQTVASRVVCVDFDCWEAMAPMATFMVGSTAIA